MTPDGCSCSASGAFVGSGESVAVRGVYDDMMVMKKQMISLMPAPRGDKK